MMMFLRSFPYRKNGLMRAALFNDFNVKMKNLPDAFRLGFILVFCQLSAVTIYQRSLSTRRRPSYGISLSFHCKASSASRLAEKLGK